MSSSSTIDIINICRQNLPKFQKIIGGFEDRGILNSEMLAVCSLAEANNVEIFIESGRFMGQSTEILAKYFKKGPPKLISIEIFKDHNGQYVENKLKQYSNLELLYGDSYKVIPDLVKQYKDKKIAILFDGPKGQDAINIYNYCLSLSPNIVISFFHDTRKPSSELPNPVRELFTVQFPQAFYTDHLDYLKEFSSLDTACISPVWQPYKIKNKVNGSYGPTLAVITPTINEIKQSQINHLKLHTICILKHLYFRSIIILDRIKIIFGIDKNVQ